ncbi:hypothetical protein [Tropicimonas sp. IMCC6043]|uniref:hypothetical protein n=1 Tax=Tropicimonas sp. IMCC6043 TaxID=2510645 RepID=UPI0013ED93DC|nr:hypothetical protein [Tropicimonas sp. IMCC6043]
MKRLVLAAALTSVGGVAQAEDFCLINLNGKTIQCYPSKSLCENRASNMRGWVCEKR